MNWLLSNDQLIARSEASISYLDRGYVFGDGIYEVFRVYNGRMFKSELHYKRLERSLNEVKLQLPYPIEQLDRLLNQLIQEEQLTEGTVYLQITRGVAPRAHAFPDLAEPILIAYCTPLERPLESMAGGISVITDPDIRWLRCDIKTINLLPNILAKQTAIEQGVDDVIFHREGTVTESSSSNVFVVRDGAIRTHPANHLILHGITRLVIRDLAEQLEIPFIEEAFQLQDLTAADEVFISSTSAEVTPVISIDGAHVKDGLPGPVVRRLQHAFESLLV